MTIWPEDPGYEDFEDEYEEEYRRLDESVSEELDPDGIYGDLLDDLDM